MPKVKQFRADIVSSASEEIIHDTARAFMRESGYLVMLCFVCDNAQRHG
jgi:hypothetical protein